MMPLPICARRMNVDGGDHRRPALQVIGEVLAAQVPQPVRHAVRLDRLIAFEIEQRVDVAVAGRVAVEGGDDVGPRRMADFGLGFDGVVEGMDDQVRPDVGIAQPLRQTMGQRLLETCRDSESSEKMKPPSAGSCRAISSASSRMRPQTGSIFRPTGLGCMPHVELSRYLIPLHGAGPADDLPLSQSYVTCIIWVSHHNCEAPRVSYKTIHDRIPSPSPHIEAFVDGSIGWLVLNRPERRNALNAAMWAAIPPLMKSLDDSPDVRVIVIRGAGAEAFAAGADISEFGEARQRCRSRRRL